MSFRPMSWLTSLMLLVTMTAESDPQSPEEVGEQVEYQLQPIVVTATRTPHTLWESDANVAVLSWAEIEQSTAQHLGDVLKMLPGVNIGTYGDIGQNVSLGIRGSTAEQVLIMVDGVPINDPQHGGLDLNLISLDNVERIEVIRGAASPLYGADALGGVVNIITKSSTYDKPLSGVSYQQGDYGLEKIAGRFARRLGQHLGLNLMASSTKTDGFRDNSSFLGRHLAGKLNYAIGDRWQVSYSTQIYRANLGVPGMDIMPTPEARQRDRSWNQALSLQASLGQGRQLDLILYRNFSRQEYENPDWFTEATHRWWIYGFELQHSHSVGRAHRLTWGGELQNRRLDSTENGRHHLDRGAVYAQDELNLHESLRLRLAGRYDYHEQFDDQLCPDLTLTWFPGNCSSIFASLRRSYRAPTFNDLFWPQYEYDYDFDEQPDYKESGNVHVKPEKAVALQVGARALVGGLMGNVCIFRREVRDLIQWENVDESYLYGYWMPVNKSEATIMGLEGQATARIWGRLKVSLAYTLLEAKDELLDKRLPYQPRHQFTGHLQHGLVLVADQLELVGRLELEYLGECFADAWEGERLPSSIVANGKVAARALDGFQLFLVGKNLGDEKSCLRKGYPLPGRTFYGGLSWEFWD